MRARWNPTPRDLLILGAILGAVASVALVFILLAALGATEDGVGAVVFEAIIAVFLLPMAAYLAGVSRTSARASKVIEHRLLAVVVGRQAGRLLYPTGRVVAATESGVVELRSRLIGEPQVLTAVPYQDITRCDASWDDLTIETVDRMLRLDAVPPTQGKLFAALVSSRARLPVDASAFAAPLS